MTLDNLLRVAGIVVAILASLPALYAIRKQLRTEELEDSLKKADIAASLVDSVGDIQTFYTKLFEEQNEIVCRIEGKVDFLTKENKELKEIVKKQNRKIGELEEGILILIEQIKELGVEPKYPKGKSNAIRN